LNGEGYDGDVSDNDIEYYDEYDDMPTSVKVVRAKHGPVYGDEIHNLDFDTPGAKASFHSWMDHSRPPSKGHKYSRRQKKTWIRKEKRDFFIS
jgi:hypothetical protein